MGLDVVCLGGVAVDRVYRLSHLPQPGSGAHIIGMDRAGGGVEANVASALARLGIRVGLIVAFDLPDSFEDLVGRGLSRDDFWKLVPQIDLLMTNSVGLTSLVEMGRPQAAFVAFRKRAPEVGVAMSMGIEGAWLGRDVQQVHVDAFQVQAVDTTGAGDAFHAGLVYGLLLENWPLQRAGLFASALAALNCGGLGARGGLVHRDGVIRFLSSQGLNW